MGTIASTTFQCGWVPQGEPSVFVTPGVIQFKKGSPKYYNVYVDVYVDGQRLDCSKFTCSTLASSSTLTTGLLWTFVTDGGRFYYRLTYTGTADINMEVPFKVTLNGAVYNCAFTLATFADGAPGESVKGDTGPYCPPPQWWEDYPDGYEFQNGVTDCEGNPATRKDTVFHGTDGDGKAIAYECIKSHKKGQLKNNLGITVNDQPDKNLGIAVATGGRAWRKGNSFHLISTNVMLANFAYINLLSSNGIRIYNESGEITGQMSSVKGSPTDGGATLPFFIGGVMQENGTFATGKTPLFAVDTSGRTYHGGTTGQRIVIDPISKRMEVYNSSGALSAIHSGETLDYNAVGASASGTAPATISANDIKRTMTGSKTEYSDTLANGSALADGTLNVTIPAVSIVTGDTAEREGGNSAELYLKVTVAGKETSHFLGATVAASESYISPARTVSVGVKKGASWSVRLMYVSNLSANGTVGFMASQNGSAGVTVVNRVCHYGANGWYISTSNTNYAYCIFDTAGKMHFKIVAGGVTVFDTDDATKHF